MKRKDIPAASPNLGGVEKRFVHWRKSKSKREPIPQELWQAAVCLSSKHSIHEISRKLHLNYNALKQRISSTHSKSSGRVSEESGCTFVEVGIEKKILPESCVVELEDSKGMKMRMHLSGLKAVLELARAFWRDAS